jgi:hypothetical protein
MNELVTFCANGGKVMGTDTWIGGMKAEGKRRRGQYQRRRKMK